MGDKTGIEWTDATWNVMTGCTKISPGCDNCYANTVAQTKTREVYLKQLPVIDNEANRADPFAPRFWPERLDQPLRWKRGRLVFVNSMSDVFHAHFTLDMIAQVFDVMNRAPQHQFQVLTKRPERAVRLAHHFKWTPNIQMGASIENMDVAKRADALRQLPAAVRFLSCEPLLGDLGALDLTEMHWVIGGGESGNGFRACDVGWARAIRDNCIRSGVPFMWKQWGGRTPKSGGRELDGRTWDEYPTAQVPAEAR